MAAALELAPLVAPKECFVLIDVCILRPPSLLNRLPYDARFGPRRAAVGDCYTLGEFFIPNLIFELC